MAKRSSRSRKLRVGILFGGKSGEHEVSLSSARGVIDAIDKNKYEIVPIGITKAGTWFAGGDPLRELTEAAGLQRLASQRTQDSIREEERSLAPFLEPEIMLPSSSAGRLDVIFPILHGPFGEDGTVQGFLELAGIPYVGAGVTASAVSMDKALTKDVFISHGLPTVPWLVFLRREIESRRDAVIEDIERRFTYPVFIKPANLGSSVGITKAHDRRQLDKGLCEAARYDRKIVVEQGIPAREIEVSVLGNDDPIASIPGEILPSREFYSYAAKYIDDASELLIPAPLSEEQTERARSLATAAFSALDLAGMARVDFLLNKENGELFLNEVNTIPGFTPISMYPKLWEASGISYSELIDRLISLALERFDDKARSLTNFDVSQAE